MTKYFGKKRSNVQVLNYLEITMGSNNRGGCYIIAFKLHSPLFLEAISIVC